MDNDDLGPYWDTLKRMRGLRSQEEIAAKYKETEGEFLNFAGDVLLPCLDFEHARPFLKPEVTEAEWDKERVRPTKESVLGELRNYMDFAWGKVEDHRGISASRSVDKLSAYVWLLGDDATLSEVEEAGFAQYGAPKLAVICRAYDLPIPEDEGIQRMIRGESCGSYEDCGCGR
jgi:hypothetical protein